MSSTSAHSRATVLRAGIASLLLVLATSATGSLLTLDPSFGTNGAQRVGLVPADSGLDHVRPLPAGGWLALGSVGGHIVIAHYLASGSLDSSFGTGGVLQLNALPPQVGASTFEIDAAGRWLIGASGAPCASDPCVYRLLADGTLDGTFANGGVAGLPPGNPGAKASSILALPGGGMLVAGQTTGGTGVLRLAADGTVDATFGVNGITVLPARPVLPFGSPTSVPTSLRFASSGGLYLATANYPDPFPYLRQPDLHRLDANGHPDPTFGAGGTLALAVDATSFGQIEELPGGKFVGLGTFNTGAGASGNHFLYQFDMTGTLDPSFGVGGKADAGVHGVPLFARPSPRFARSGSKYLVPGALSGDLALARLNADGSPDPSFGTAGIVAAGLTTGSQMNSMAVATGIGGEVLAIGNANASAVTLHIDSGGLATSQWRAVAAPLIDVAASLATVVRAAVSTGGKVALIGSALGAPGDGGIAMLEANGLPSPAFGQSGHVLAADLGMLGTVWTDGAFQDDGKLVVAGYHGAANSLVRLDANGALDPTFGGTGIVEYPSAGGTTRSAAVAVQPDGKIVTAVHDYSTTVAIQRFSSLGALDAGFGVGGESDVTGPFPFTSVAAVMFPAGGKMLIAGGADLGSFHKWFVLRLLASGVPDPSYGTGGIVYVTPSTPPDQTVSAAMQPDGSVVLGGRINGAATLARVTPAGQLDPTFGTAGLQPLFQSGSEAMSIAVTDAGDTVVAARDASGNWLALRLLNGGSPDPTFGLELLSTVPVTDALRLATRGGRVAIAGVTTHSPGFDERALVKAYTIASTPPSLPQRSFVASYGNDTAACSVVAPCRTLAQALKTTARGGEVLLLDSADFGSATILTSVSIVAPQNARPAITGTPLVDALTVSATPSDTIVLRGLAVAGDSDGIVFNSGGSLHLENLTVRGNPLTGAAGVWFQPATPARLSIKDSTIQSYDRGIVAASFADVGVLLDNVRLEGNRWGLSVSAAGTVAVRNALVAGPGDIGIRVVGAGGVPLTATLDRVTISGVAQGLIVGGSEPATAFVRNSSFASSTYQGLLVGCCAPASAIWIDGNRITRNGVGIEIFAGAVNSRGNNTIEANGVDGAPTATYSAK